MKNVLGRTAVLAGIFVSAFGVLATEAVSVASAKDIRCKLDRLGNGNRNCQCEILTNKSASPKILRKLEELKVCNSSIFETSLTKQNGPRPPRDTPPPSPKPPDCDGQQTGHDSSDDQHNNEANSTRHQ